MAADRAGLADVKKNAEKKYKKVLAGGFEARKKKRPRPNGDAE